MKVLVSGSSGLIGTHLCMRLAERGHDVFTLVRDKKLVNDIAIYWKPEKQEIDMPRIEGMEAVINLAGQNVASGRWNIALKDKIYGSRIDSTKLLVDSFRLLAAPPAVFLNASAVGYYGDRAAERLTEGSSPGRSFLAEVAEEWEAEALKASSDTLRVVLLRFGMVLSTQGGALQRMLFPFKLGLGGRIGPGTQFISWISLPDAVNAILFVLEGDSVSGPVNIVAPNPVSNFFFAYTLAQTLKRPALCPLPAFIARMLLGEMADELLLSSVRVTPERLSGNGFIFQHPDLTLALDKVIKLGV